MHPRTLWRYTNGFTYIFTYYTHVGVGGWVKRNDETRHPTIGQFSDCLAFDKKQTMLESRDSKPGFHGAVQ